MRINYIIVLASMFFMQACSKDLQLEEVSFNVTADSTSYNLGSKTTFTFSGKPQFINFYSGEIGKRNGAAAIAGQGEIGGHVPGSQFRHGITFLLPVL
mgnify:CR=1 FL=1